MFGYKKKAGVNMNKKEMMKDEDARKLTKQEMSQVDGGQQILSITTYQCPNCGFFFDTKLLLQLHMNNCNKKNG